MIKRIIEISTAGTYLSVHLGQLLIRQDGQLKGQIPCEDIGVLLIDHPAVTCTHSVLTVLLEQGAAVITCNGKHLPAGLLLPLESNSVQAERFREQIAAGESLKKRLWKQIVQAKIAHQARLVRSDPQTRRALMALRRRVRSGDPDNIEAQASARFWPAFLQDPSFRRHRQGPPPNSLLNYGYIVLRAAVARALCSAGLLPTLGIHHRNRYNAFALADDLIEPFRGFVEEKVRELYAQSNPSDGELTKETKAALLEVLYRPVVVAGFKGPLMVALHRTAASLARCFAGQQKTLDLPVYD
ncbi:MAG TPA: type II CRISPR-associated endonuclease Cas1 [Anaerohalosphaeraceae bacterium]|nr:type II CRISPR-associated endonuclease Cas1 [Anaerohalosphaeraceae bacterium]HOL89799.1 type II CRISPR-associated endonuclease Cas1 [Anaerohalosphaeraceae bacterium]HPP57273.1 type II CRISPR-associated endonuclease Cas1 [Anaerohalosphaeraceae bacterium]